MLPSRPEVDLEKGKGTMSNKKSQIPRKPELLSAFLQRMLDGDNLHKDVKPLPAPTRQAIESALALFNAAFKRSIDSKVAAETAKQDLKGAKEAAIAVARNGRDVVYGLYSHSDKIVGDYGLATPIKHTRSVEAKDDANEKAKADAKTEVKAELAARSKPGDSKPEGDAKSK